MNFYIKYFLLLLLFNFSYAMELDVTEQRAKLLEQMKEKYGVNNKRCHVYISKTQILPEFTCSKDRVNFEIVCLLAGFKDVVWRSDDNFDDFDEDVKKLITLSNDIKFAKITYADLENEGKLAASYVLYRKNEDLIGLKLLKYELERLLYNEGYYNRYLLGLLLGYPKEAIEFFYQFESFSEYCAEKKLDLKANDSSNFIQWPEEYKIIFEEFVNKIWNQEAKCYYLLDQGEAIVWLINHCGISEESIESDMEILYSQINQCTNKLEAQK